MIMREKIENKADFRIQEYNDKFYVQKQIKTPIHPFLFFIKRYQWFDVLKRNYNEGLGWFKNALQDPYAYDSLEEAQKALEYILEVPKIHLPK